MSKFWNNLFNSDMSFNINKEEVNMSVATEECYVKVGFKKNHYINNIHETKNNYKTNSKQITNNEFEEIIDTTYYLPEIPSNNYKYKSKKN